MVKRSKKIKTMEETQTTKRYYYIAFRERPTVDEVTSPFSFPMIAGYVGFEGDDGLSFEGITSSCDNTHFHTTAKLLNDKKATKNQIDLKAAAEKYYNNNKKIEGGTCDFVAKPFAEILTNFIENRQVAAYPEDKKKLKNKLYECSNTVNLPKATESESNGEEEDEPDIFDSQEVEFAQKSEESTASLIKEIEDLSAMEAWQMGEGEHEIFERLMKLAQNLEKKLKTIITAERDVNEDFADLVTYKVMKQLREAEKGHKVTQEALKASHDILSKQVKSAQTSIKTTFRYQQEKFANVGSKMKEVAENLRLTNMKLNRDLRPDQSTSQRYLLPNTPESTNNKFSSRRSSGASSNNGYMPMQPERQHILPHPRNCDYPPPARENSRHLEDTYPPKRAKRATPEHGQGAIEVFDDDYYQWLRMDGLR